MGDKSIKGSNKSILRGPHGHGPKPYLHKPGVGPHGHLGGRKKKAIGGAIKKVIQGGKKIIDKIKTGKSNKFDTWETIGIPGSPGPHKGKYPAIDKVMKNIEKQKKKGIKEPGYDPDFKAKGGRIGLNHGVEE